MFDVFPRALASVASVLFPIFASYKALQTADPAQLTPWLMYWVVLACVLLVESWTDWLLAWIPLYHYARLAFLLYLVLPQTQGARVLYQTHVHPWLQHHEARIDHLIASAHHRLRAAGAASLRRALAYVRELLGLPPSAAEAEAANAAHAAPPPPTTAASYTQALLSRFSLPSARWPGGAGMTQGDVAAAPPTTGGAANTGSMYGLLSGAVDRALRAATAAATPGTTTTAAAAADTTPTQRAALRDNLRSLLTALDRADEDGGALHQSRSEPDFVRVDAESGAEDDGPAGLRQRTAAATSSGGSWMPWWGTAGASETAGGTVNGGKENIQ